MTAQLAAIAENRAVIELAKPGFTDRVGLWGGL
jgi:hypothetical protein